MDLFEIFVLQIIKEHRQVVLGIVTGLPDSDSDSQLSLGIRQCQGLDLIDLIWELKQPHGVGAERPEADVATHWVDHYEALERISRCL